MAPVYMDECQYYATDDVLLHLLPPFGFIVLLCCLFHCGLYFNTQLDCCRNLDVVHKNQLPKMACAMCHAQRAAKTSFAAAMVLSMSSSVCAKEVKPASYCEGAK